GAAFGATVGSIGGLLVVLIIYLLKRKDLNKKMLQDRTEKREASRSIVKTIFAIAIPITIGAAAMPIMNLVEVPIISSRLMATGWAQAEAETLYGELSGMVVPLINFPQVLMIALAMSLVPTIAAAYKDKDKVFLNYNIEMALRLSMLIGLPASVGLIVLAKPIMLLLYPAQQEAAMQAVPALIVLASSIVFQALAQSNTAALQGIGRQMIPVNNLFVGIIIKVILTFVLTGIASLNIAGAAMGTVAAYIAIAFLNYRSTVKITKAHFDKGILFIRPVISAAVMGIVTAAVFMIAGLAFSDKLATLLAILSAVFAYGVMLIITKSISAEELKRIPVIGKIASKLKKSS
ncbi:MAG: polysaccharide biosynthesis C-terminal domain-containing protein, partial [Anaerovoracaceae bacterium]